MRRLACFVVTEDEVFSCIPAGSRYIDLVSSSKQKTILQMSDLITTHNAGCKVIIRETLFVLTLYHVVLHSFRVFIEVITNLRPRLHYRKKNATPWFRA